VSLFPEARKTAFLRVLSFSKAWAGTVMSAVTNPGDSIKEEGIYPST
jgi:hypothetical protein